MEIRKLAKKGDRAKKDQQGVAESEEGRPVGIIVILNGNQKIGQESRSC